MIGYVKPLKGRFTFDIKIYPYTGTAGITLNSRALSPKSQLRICSAGNFFDWYKGLPDLLYAEVNDGYEVRLSCPEMEYRILEAVFGTKPECQGLTYTPDAAAYSMEHRITWMKDAARNMGVTLPEIPGFSLRMLPDDPSARSRVGSSLENIYRARCTRQEEAVNIWIASREHQDLCESSIRSGRDLIIVPEGGSGLRVELGSRGLMVKTDPGRIAGAVMQWVDLAVLAPFLMSGREKLRRLNGNLSFQDEARIQMLTREDPVVRSRIPDRIETGNFTDIALDGFPSGSLSLKISDPGILIPKEGRLLAGKTGTADIEIISERGTVLLTQTIEVYSVKRVASVSLSLPGGNTVLDGDTFTVSASLSPADAVNKNKARWTCDPAVLKDLGGGRFKALAPGKHAVTLTVENVHCSVTVNVAALCTDIQMAPSLQAKVKKTTAPFHASVLPAGSACKRIDVRITDQSIASWNGNKKEVVPVSEGDTELVVTAYDADGNIAAQKKCRVTVLPEEDVVTPAELPTLLAACTIIAALTAGTRFLPSVLWVGLGLSIVEIVKNLQPVLKKCAVDDNKLELAVGLAGLFLFGGILATIYLR